tara:strand:- start:144 stop:431 length:288 start_codon:yes stop_codon:yes gene_type:complete
MTEKKNEMTTEMKDLMEKFVNEARENDLLRAHSRHSMRLGNVELDIIPTDKTQSLEDVMKQFAEFAKLLKELHGDAHLNAPDGTGPNSSMRGMFE